MPAPTAFQLDYVAERIKQTHQKLDNPDLTRYAREQLESQLTEYLKWQRWLSGKER